MGRVYVSNRFSLHMLNDITLLKADGAMNVAPITMTEAQNIIKSVDNDSVFTVDLDLSDEFEFEFDHNNLLHNIRLQDDDVLIVALIHGRGGNPKLYRVSY